MGKHYRDMEADGGAVMKKIEIPAVCPECGEMHGVKLGKPKKRN